jgi:hypothetical protein
MSVPVSAGYPQYSYNANPAGSAFIPEIWSGKLQVKFYKSTVLGEITNNDWEGEIKNQGDTVHIRSIPTITISSYTKGQNLSNQVPTSTPIELTIDYGKYFSVIVDDVDAVQADVMLLQTTKVQLLVLSPATSIWAQLVLRFLLTRPTFWITS